MRTDPDIRTMVARCVFALLTLLLALSSKGAQGEEPIQRAFGQTLGELFDASVATRSTADSRHVIFWYPAPGQVPELTEFFVTVTPLTYRIYAIAAIGHPSGLEPCRTVAVQLFSIIAKKYDGEQYGSDMRELTNGRGWFLTQSKTRRRINISCDDKQEKTELWIGYVDEAVKQAADTEQQELTQMNTAYEAANYDKILPRLRQLAQQGNQWAQTMLGLMYGKGKGVPHDDDTAEDDYLQAAQRGWLAAEYNLGTFYMIRFRYKPAETWLLKAAERGYPEAEENLAQLYLAKSPLQSEEKAFTWFLRAAEHGQPESQYNTCYDYADGLGVTRDMVEAYKWCYIAASHGHARADRNKDHLAGQMRAEEVARGREAAEHWLAQENTAAK